MHSNELSEIILYLLYVCCVYYSITPTYQHVIVISFFLYRKELSGKPLSDLKKLYFQWKRKQGS